MAVRKVIWVFGTSAAGKETFIRACATDPALARSLFGGEIVTSEASLDHIGQFVGDPVADRREHLLTEVPDLLTRHETVLVKWQVVDSQAQRPQRLAAALPDLRHSIVELTVPLAELVQRLKRKPWWTAADVGSEEPYLTTELDLVAAHLAELNWSTPVLRLSSSATGTYTATP